MEGGTIDIDTAAGDVLFDGPGGALKADNTVTINSAGSIANTASTAAATIETSGAGSDVTLNPSDIDIASTGAFVVDSSGAFTLDGPMSGTAFTVDAVDKLTIGGKMTATGGVDLQSSSDEVEINADIDPTTVVLDGATNVDLNANVTGTTSVEIDEARM